jgi:hypothetical protein
MAKGCHETPPGNRADGVLSFARKPRVVQDALSPVLSEGHSFRSAPVTDISYERVWLRRQI